MAVDEEVIRGWKRKYGQVFSVSARGVDYYFRPLTFREFDDVRLDPESSAEAEESIVAYALLDPEKLDDRVPAGVITSIAMQVMEVSGFGNPAVMNRVLEAQRERTNGDVRCMMKAMIISAMPAHDDDRLDDLTFEALAKKTAMAELIMQVQQRAIGVESNDLKVHIIDPEEEEQRQQEEMQKHAAQKKPGTAGFNDPIAQKLYEALTT